MIVDCAVVAAPAAKVTAAVVAIATPLILPVSVAGPASVADVKVAVYVPPPPLSAVTVAKGPGVAVDDSVPAVVVSVIAKPLVVLFPCASFSWIVISDVVTPSAVIGDVPALTVDCAVVAAPAVTS